MKDQDCPSSAIEARHGSQRDGDTQGNFSEQGSPRLMRTDDGKPLEVRRLISLWRHEGACLYHVGLWQNGLVPLFKEVGNTAELECQRERDPRAVPRLTR